MCFGIIMRFGKKRVKRASSSDTFNSDDQVDGGEDFVEDRWTNQVSDKGVAGLQAEFKTIECADPRATDDDTPNKCHVSMEHTNGAYPYYNANRIKIGKKSPEFICASQPTSETAAAFWAMVANGDYTIYAFNDCFYPTEENKMLTFGETPNLIKVTYKSHVDDDWGWGPNIHAAIVIVESPFGPPKEVVIREFDDFAIERVDRGPNYTSSLPSAHAYIGSEKTKTILIVSNDAGYSTMLPMYKYVMDCYWDKKDPMPMADLVKKIRQRRPGAIGTEAQYLFLHDKLMQINAYSVNYDKWKEDYAKYEPKMNTTFKNL